MRDIELTEINDFDPDLLDYIFNLPGGARFTYKSKGVRAHIGDAGIEARRLAMGIINKDNNKPIEVTKPYLTLVGYDFAVKEIMLVLSIHPIYQESRYTTQPRVGDRYWYQFKIGSAGLQLVSANTKDQTEFTHRVMHGNDAMFLNVFDNEISAVL